MNITRDLAPDAIRKIFKAEMTSGRGTVDARKLYQLWEGTGLRRQDLASGIMLLTETHELLADVRDGGCHFTMLRRPRKRGVPRISASALDQRALALAQAATRMNSTARHHRSADVASSATGGERRLGECGRLISAMPLPDREVLLGLVELVPMTTASVLWEVGERINYAYFPINCIFSNRIELEDGHSNEIHVTGNEGMAGLEVCQGQDRASYSIVVEQGGFAHRLPASTLRKEFDRGEEFQALLLRYSHAQLMQVALGSTCNHYHSIKSRLCRVLLLIADRSRSNTLRMTHDVIAGSVGVRREAITEWLGQLHDAGLIRRARKSITLLDRHGLEAISCECYAAIKAEFDSMRPDSPARLRANTRMDAPDRTERRTLHS